MEYKLEEKIFDTFIYHLKMVFVPFQGNNFSPQFFASRILLYFIVCLYKENPVWVHYFLYVPAADRGSSHLGPHLWESIKVVMWPKYLPFFYLKLHSIVSAPYTCPRC